MPVNPPRWRQIRAANARLLQLPQGNLPAFESLTDAELLAIARLQSRFELGRRYFQQIIERGLWRFALRDQLWRPAHVRDFVEAVEGAPANEKCKAIIERGILEYLKGALATIEELELKRRLSEGSVRVPNAVRVPRELLD